MTLNEIQKKQLLKQVEQNAKTIEVSQLVALINKYDNLSKEDFKDVLSADKYKELLDSFHDPVEKATWEALVKAPRGSLEELSTLKEQVRSYISKYQMSEDSHVREAEDLMETVRQEIRRFEGEIKERKDWDNLDKNNFNDLARYLERYPDSMHRDEIDDCMWTVVTAGVTIRVDKLEKYVDVMPQGKHVGEAKRAIEEYAEWDEVKRQGDIITMKRFVDNHPESPFFREARNRYYDLRDEELKNMREDVSDYNLDKLYQLFDAGIFEKEDLMAERLITEHSWDILTKIDRDMLPKIDQTPDPDIAAPEGCTDIFFFGTPSTGKTCLLMGLAGANGAGYSLDMVGKGGQYISDLTVYANNGITPDRTYGSFVTVINGVINEESKKGIIRHPVNLIEMSGEEFALKIAQNPQNLVSFENMGTGATRLLMNNNRKVFFIIVDPTKVMVPFRYRVERRDDEGNVVDYDIKKTYISQNIILAKLTSLFTRPENARIMEKVDSIHFIVTKSDVLGEMRNVRTDEARKRLVENYGAAVGQLKDYVRQSARINRSMDYKVNAYTFSLGQFYLGDVFELDNTDTHLLIDAIRSVTFGNKERTWWDRLKGILN